MHRLLVNYLVRLFQTCSDSNSDWPIEPVIRYMSMNRPWATNLFDDPWNCSNKYCILIKSVPFLNISSLFWYSFSNHGRSGRSYLQRIRNLFRVLLNTALARRRPGVVTKYCCGRQNAACGILSVNPIRSEVMEPGPRHICQYLTKCTFTQNLNYLYYCFQFQ